MIKVSSHLPDLFGATAEALHSLRQKTAAGAQLALRSRSSYVPKRSGDLRNSYVVRPLGRLDLVLKSDLVYAPVIEYARRLGANINRHRFSARRTVDNYIRTTSGISGLNQGPQGLGSGERLAIGAGQTAKGGFSQGAFASLAGHASQAFQTYAPIAGIIGLRVVRRRATVLVTERIGRILSRKTSFGIGAATATLGFRQASLRAGAFRVGATRRGTSFRAGRTTIRRSKRGSFNVARQGRKLRTSVGKRGVRVATRDKSLLVGRQGINAHTGSGSFVFGPQSVQGSLVAGGRLYTTSYTRIGVKTFTARVGRTSVKVAAKAAVIKRGRVTVRTGRGGTNVSSRVGPVRVSAGRGGVKVRPTRRR